MPNNLIVVIISRLFKLNRSVKPERKTLIDQARETGTYIKKKTTKEFNPVKEGRI